MESQKTLCGKTSLLRFRIGRLTHHQTLMPALLTWVPYPSRLRFLFNLSSPSRHFLYLHFPLLTDLGSDQIDIRWLLDTDPLSPLSPSHFHNDDFIKACPKEYFHTFTNLDTVFLDSDDSSPSTTSKKLYTGGCHERLFEIDLETRNITRVIELKNDIHSGIVMNGYIFSAT